MMKDAEILKRFEDMTSKERIIAYLQAEVYKLLSEREAIDGQISAINEKITIVSSQPERLHDKK